MPVVGTAGHVDHGKSALVLALTGVDPDRLADEKRRGMTIDLGFAYLPLPGVGEVGIVDVPGHARFLPNMLAGVHGLDAVLLVVAADEGIKPQTREHLDIVGLVGVDRVMVALTKVDLVTDGTRLARVEAEVTAELGARGLAADIVRVAAPIGVGVDDVREALARLLGGVDARGRASGAPRLPVDRVFVMTGFGPVVTGTLVGGELRVGQEVELVPSGRSGVGHQARRARVRGLQQHGRAVQRAAPGSRVAVNIQGIDRDLLGRGQVLAMPRALATTDRVTLTLRVLSGAPRGIAHNSQATVFSGTASAPARVRVIEDGQTEITAGGSGLVELRLGAPMAILEGDAVVLRRPAPAGTIAGGRVTSAHPPRYNRRHGTWTSTAEVRGVEARLVEAVRAYLVAHPARSGMPLAELTQAHGLDRRAVAEALGGLAAAGRLAQANGLVSVPGWKPRLTAAQSAATTRVLARLAQAPLSPPRTGELARDGLDETVRRYLEEQQMVVRIAPDLLLLPNAVADAGLRLRAHIEAHGGTTVADARDVLGSSRRTVVPLLEYFDAVKLTRRVGDVRVLAG